MHNTKRSTLLLIEFQNEWLTPEGKLFGRMQDQGLFKQSQVNASACLLAARNAGLPCVHSGLSFKPDYSELGDAKTGVRNAIKKRQTFLQGTKGAEFHKDFMPQGNEFVVSGRAGSSAFASSNLHAHLQENAIETIYVMGYALHVCIESSIRQAHDLGYEVVLIDDSCAAFNRKQQSHMIEEILPHFGTHI